PRSVSRAADHGDFGYCRRKFVRLEKSSTFVLAAYRNSVRARASFSAREGSPPTGTSGSSNTRARKISSRVGFDENSILPVGDSTRGMVRFTCIGGIARDSAAVFVSPAEAACKYAAMTRTIQR